MKRKVFALTMIIGFIWGSLAFAWQDPCSATENAYTLNGFTLDNWIETGPHFSPTPECAGTVTLWAPDGTESHMNYVGNNGIMNIAGVPCRLSDKGNLVCKTITQPEESEILILGKRE